MHALIFTSTTISLLNYTPRLQPLSTKSSLYKQPQLKLSCIYFLLIKQMEDIEKKITKRH